jgi:hypothetical protein
VPRRRIQRRLAPKNKSVSDHKSGEAWAALISILHDGRGEQSRRAFPRTQRLLCSEIFPLLLLGTAEPICGNRCEIWMHADSDRIHHGFPLASLHMSALSLSVSAHGSLDFDDCPWQKKTMPLMFRRNQVLRLNSAMTTIVVSPLHIAQCKRGDSKQLNVDIISEGRVM